MKHDNEKPRYTLIPASPLAMVARVLTYGARIYSDNNWEKAFKGSSLDGERRYLDATMRHIQAHRMGEITDPESGEPHLAHAVCSLLFILAWLAEEVVGNERPS